MGIGFAGDYAMQLWSVPDCSSSLAPLISTSRSARSRCVAVGSGECMSARMASRMPAMALVVSAELSLDSGFEFVHAPGQFLVAGYHFAQPHEGAHDR